MGLVEKLVVVRGRMADYLANVMRCHSCNVDGLAKKTRQRIHKTFYDWGCFVYRHHIGIFIMGMLLLVLPCFGIKYLKVETNVDKLLISSSGRVSKETEFTQKHYGAGMLGPDTQDSQSIIQVVRDEGDSILTKENLLDHKNLLLKVFKIKVPHKDSSGNKTVMWELKDFCQRFTIPYFGSNQKVAKMIHSLSPCHIVTPLDCFFEGAYIASPTWTPRSWNHVTSSPQDILDALIFVMNLHRLGKGYLDIASAEKFMKKMDFGGGYQSKSCLNGNDTYCRQKTPKDVDIGAELTGGCHGLARNYMSWPQETLVSGINKNSTGSIKTAKALQSVISIHHPSMWSKIAPKQKMKGLDEHEAAEILKKWKDKFMELVNTEGAKLRDTKMLTFTKTKYQDQVNGMSMFKTKASMLGCVLTVIYAIITLKRWTNAIHSYGALGFIGVVLVSISVTNGLGLSSFMQMSLSTGSIQVLPYLAVGLGLDNMFLLVRTYVFVCDTGKFTDRKIVGMVLGECGLSITITSITNAVAFFMASIIPTVDVLEGFARQASVMIVLNWFTMIVVLPAILSFDVERQKDQRYDLYCCFKRVGEEDDEEFSVGGRHHVGCTLNNRDTTSSLDIPLSTTTSTTTATEQDTGENADAYNVNITSNDNNNNNNINNNKDDNDNNNNNNNDNSNNNNNNNINYNNNNSSKCIPNNNDSYSSTGISSKFVLDRSRRQFNVKPQKRTDAEKPESPSLCTLIIQRASLTYFAQNYYGRWLSCVQIKIVVLFLCAVQLFLAGYGCIQVKRGLNVTDVMTPGTTPYEYLSAERKYFSFQHFYIALKSEKDGKMFNFSTVQNQGRIRDLHNRIKKLKNVSPTVDMWLTTYSTWLKDAETSFISQWNSGHITHECMQVHDEEDGQEDDRQRHRKCNATKPARIIYRLLETAVPHDQYPGTIRSNWTRIVDKDGFISPQWFYDGLTLWYHYDEKGREKSKVSLRPTGEAKPRLDDYYLPGEDSSLPEILLMPYSAANLTDDEDYISLIEDVRGVCDEFWRKYDLPSYPIGQTFTFWDQFTFVERKLLVAGSVVLLSVALLILLTFMSLRATVIVVFFLLVTMFEVYGVLGWLNIEVNVISAITLVVSVGVAGEFTIHTVLAFINTPGDRNDRMRGALEITFAPLVDSAVSTIIMILVLATSQYSFIIKYFFIPVVCLMCTALINGVVVLPVVLSFFGPCCEITNNSIRPTMNPIFHIPIDITINIDLPHLEPQPRQWMRGHNPRHPDNVPAYLSTIQEVSERSSPTIKTIYNEHRTSTGGSNKSSRPGTPYFRTASKVPEEFDNTQSPGDDKIDKATFKEKSKTSAWHHTPQLLQDEEFSPRLSKQINRIRQLPPGSLRNKKRHRNNAHDSNNGSRHYGNNKVNINDDNNNVRTSQRTKCFGETEGDGDDALYSNNTVVGPRYTVCYYNNSNIIINSNNSNNNDNNSNNSNNNSNNSNNSNNNDNNNNKNNKTRSSSSSNYLKSSNSCSNNGSNINISDGDNKNKSPPATHPQVIRVQPVEESNRNTCSTKVKATLSIEVTHPFAVTSHHEEYKSGLARVDY